MIIKQIYSNILIYLLVKILLLIYYGYNDNFYLVNPNLLIFYNLTDLF